jgi:ribosomal subunit interface protein
MVTTTFPIQISWREIPSNNAVEKYIQQKALKLATFYSRVTSCQVRVEPFHQHRQQGKLYHVRIELEVPGKVLVVNRQPQLHMAHKDLYVAIRDAFEEAQRQLQKYADHLHQEVKSHASEPRGAVSKLFPQEGYGFIIAPDGREIYFHRHSVLAEGFDKLGIGTEVTFVEEPGEQGPQASTVRQVTS